MLLKSVCALLKIDFYSFEVIVYFITGVFSVLVHNRLSALTVDGYSSLCYSQMLIHCAAVTAFCKVALIVNIGEGCLRIRGLRRIFGPKMDEVTGE